ncbi:hypothetical protein [Paraburkholderia caffeinilytica]|uniref:hypothetical protein n=1 Tax=Paraburkholderia caffeinilytica TaxID=1761016 RepID=UPI0038BAB1D0
MKINLICPDCLEEQKKHESSSNAPNPINTRRRLTSYPVHLTNEGMYVVKCDFGHSSVIGINLMNHEILFETGVFAILDGYYREAITSFAASLERYYEFAIRSIARAHGCPAFLENKIWKDISSQSERQLGAYIYLYSIHFKENPQLLSQKMTEIRNSAVHKGLIPSFDKAISFGEAVLSIVSEGSAQIMKSVPEASHNVASEKNQFSLEKLISEGFKFSGGIQQISSAVREKISLEKHLQHIKYHHSQRLLDEHSKIIEEFDRKNDSLT